MGVVEDTVYTDVRWKNHSMYFVPIMQRQPSDKGPITDDMSLYAGTIVLETARPMSDLEIDHAEDAGGDQSEFDCGEVSNF